MRPLLLAACLFGCGDDSGSPDGGAIEPARDAATKDAAEPDGRVQPDDAAVPCAPPMIEAQVLPHTVEVGVVDPVTGLDFAPLEAGGDIPIGGTGQAGLTARLALRVSPPLERAVVDLVLNNAQTGEPAENKPQGEPRDFVCDDERCELSPVLVEISHLTKLPELEGLCVTASVALLDPNGGETLARGVASGHFVRQ